MPTQSLPSPSTPQTKNSDNSDRIDTIFSRFQQDNPNPKCELLHTDPFTLLVAVILSAQTTDQRVNTVTQTLFPIARTPQQFLQLGEHRLANIIRSIGLYREKARNIIATCRILVDDYDSSLPSTYDELLLLPGVGRKTARVVLNAAFGAPLIAVDTHVFRVSNRTAIAPGKNVALVESSLQRLVPLRFQPHAHHWLVLHGRYICKARKPLCHECIIHDLCPSSTLHP